MTKSIWKKPSKVFGAYNADDDWLNLASIRMTEDGVRGWIRETYVSGRNKWGVVPVIVKLGAEKK